MSPSSCCGPRWTGCVRRRPTSAESYPMVEVFAAFELLDMQEAGEAKRADRSELDQRRPARQLREIRRPLDPEIHELPQAVMLGQGDAHRDLPARSVHARTMAFWSWKRPIPPTDPQFEWFERVYDCRESIPRPRSERNPQGQRGGCTGEAGPEEGARILQEAIRRLAERGRGGRTGRQAQPRNPSTDTFPQLLADGDQRRSVVVDRECALQGRRGSSVAAAPNPRCAEPAAACCRAGVTRDGIIG